MRFQSILLMLLYLLFSLLFSCSKNQTNTKPTGKTEIKGRITNSLTNKPIPFLELKIITDADEFIFQTNENGEYHFKKDLSRANIV